MIRHPPRSTLSPYTTPFRPPADVRISLDRLTKRFGASTAVDGLSLEIGQGELVSLVGGSGCGKTTTLRVIAGFERPEDRKSTRLNSSHGYTSYAAFCFDTKK